MTDILKSVATDREAKRRLLARTPLGRIGEPDEIAAIAVFLGFGRCQPMSPARPSMPTAAGSVSTILCAVKDDSARLKASMTAKRSPGARPDRHQDPGRAAARRALNPFRSCRQPRGCRRVPASSACAGSKPPASSSAIRRVIDVAKLSKPVTVFAEIVLEKQARQGDLEKRLAAIEEVVECWEVSGAVDYVARFVCADLAGYQELTNRLIDDPKLGVARIVSHVALRPIRRFAGYPEALLRRKERVVVAPDFAARSIRATRLRGIMLHCPECVDEAARIRSRGAVLAMSVRGARCRKGYRDCSESNGGTTRPPSGGRIGVTCKEWRAWVGGEGVEVCSDIDHPVQAFGEAAFVQIFRRAAPVVGVQLAYAQCEADKWQRLRPAIAKGSA